LAAVNGRLKVTIDDVRAIAVSALRHRLRRDPLDESDSGMRVERALSEMAAA
jgi:magnesium chelatase subunit I